MNIGLTRGKPEPVESPDYKDLDRRIRALQAQSTALYENDEIEDGELDELVAPINAEIAAMIDRLYLPTKSRSRAAKPGERMKKMEKVINVNGTEIIWESAFGLMDNDLANGLSLKMAPCTEQELMTAYEAAHAEKFGEPWELSKANPRY